MSADKYAIIIIFRINKAIAKPMIILCEGWVEQSKTQLTSYNHELVLITPEKYMQVIH
jgi:hypothetical protein